MIRTLNRGLAVLLELAVLYVVNALMLRGL